ncbi:MAG: type II toxin-antitoxin system VapC family toxin [Theionarchaea archaeon]|nr:type II toxin-antitoxin system VapC family toxin [Theionarchaea archaeon]
MNILIDTSVFMSLFAKDMHFQKTEALFWDIIENHKGFFCSMNVNEMIWVLKRSEYDKKFIGDKVTFVFSLPLKFLTPDQDIFLESIRIMETYNLSFSDSVIAAHAVINKLKIATLDKDFKKISEIEAFGVE